MPSQNHSGRQYDKQHAVTVVATAPIPAERFVGYDGAPATQDGGVHDAQGVSEFGADAGQALAVITGYSALVEVAQAIAFGDFVQPADDGSGRAAKGSSASHCGRALGVASAAGDVIEVQVLGHVQGA